MSSGKPRNEPFSSATIRFPFKFLNSNFKNKTIERPRQHQKISNPDSWNGLEKSWGIGIFCWPCMKWSLVTFCASVHNLLYTKCIVSSCSCVLILDTRQVYVAHRDAWHHLSLNKLCISAIKINSPAYSDIMRELRSSVNVELEFTILMTRLNRHAGVSPQCRDVSLAIVST